MATLREDIHKNDFLMDKLTKKLYFVIKIDRTTVWLRCETEGDDPDMEQRPKHMINLAMIKVKPDVIKVLYGDKDGQIYSDTIPDVK